MIQSAIQAPRELALFTPLGDDVLLLRRFDGVEELSQLFEYRLEMLSADDAIDPTQIVGQNVTFTVKKGDGSPRHFNGFVSRFGHVHQTDLGTTYRATVVSWLWFLTNTADCRIFQNQTAPKIIEQIFRDLGFRDFDTTSLSADYAEREYCVQYRETDFDFVARLMEEEGIFYFFRHENGRHTLVLADRTASYFTIEDGQVEFADPDGTGDLVDQITDWQHDRHYHPGRWAQTDYNFKTPRADLMNREKTVVDLANNGAFEIYDYPGLYTESTTGRSLTRVRMEEHEVPHDKVTGSGTYRTFVPGGKIEVTTHRTRAEQGKTYVLSRVEHSASVSGSYITGTGTDELNFSTRFRCIPDQVVFRPARTTRKPVVEGPQTAMVVGPRGEEIHTDKYGRVKCQFHWDREGKLDENSSCWIRVSQIHAGKGWGAIDLPRIGEEVLVSFLEGDPDRPIIKGRLYNGKNRPPFDLPATKTRSDSKTDTYKGSGYNEMSMDDTPGAEQIRTNAQYNMDTTVGNNQTLAVGVDRTESIGNNDTLTVGVDSSTEIGNDRTAAVGNNETVTVGNNIVIEAGTSITLASGASTIHMNQAGVITISGQFITSAAMALNTTVAPMTEIVGSNMLNQVGMVSLMLGGICKINAKETEVSGATVDVRGGQVVVKGAPIKLGEAGAPMAKLPENGAADGGNGDASAAGPSGVAGDAGQEYHGGYDDIGSGGQSEHGNAARPNGTATQHVKGPDGSKIPVYEQKLPATKGGEYNVDDNGPYIVVNKDLPEHQRNEEVAHELDHAAKDYENRGSAEKPYDGDAGSPKEAEIRAQQKEIEAIKQNRNKYSNAEFKKRLEAEQKKLDAVKGRFNDVDGALQWKHYNEQTKRWEQRKRKGK